ncbi:N-acetyltransferase domain-containing protein [Vibrio alginolyticus]
MNGLNFRFADTYKPEADLPPVIVAMKSNEVIGGLAYSRYQESHGNSEVVWFNAVYVSPNWRGQGIASELISRGVSQVTSTTQSNLYAYTNVPPLYESLGWSVVDIESEPNHKVMKVQL